MNYKKSIQCFEYQIPCFEYQIPNIQLTSISDQYYMSLTLHFPVKKEEL